ncbi:MAG: sugar ABC transporter substrate-binding protein [Elusimicrobiota bacterium]
MEKRDRFYLISHGGMLDPFWQPVKKGMETAAKLLDLKATYLGPEEKYSVQALINNVNEAIAAKPDGIAVTITNAEILDEPLREAIKNNIPIIAINVPDFRPIGKRIPYLFYIGMDEYVCGRRLAERVLSEKEFMPTRAVVTIHEEGHIGLEKRVKGIKDIFRRKNIPVDTFYITTDTELATKKFCEYMEKHPKSNIIFTLGPLGTIPALNFLEKEKLFGKIKMATVDRLPNTTDDIKKGKILCTAEQGPYLQGFMPILWFDQYYKNRNVSYEDILLGPTIVDKYNIDYVEEMEKLIEERSYESLDYLQKKKFKNILKNVWNNFSKNKDDVLNALDIFKTIISFVNLFIKVS